MLFAYYLHILAVAFIAILLVYLIGKIKERYFETKQEFKDQEQPIKYSDILDKYVIIIGAGALGSHCSLELAKRGLAHLRIIDGGKINRNSISQSAVFQQEDQGHSKARALKYHLHSLFPNTRVQSIEQNFSWEKAQDMIDRPSFVIDCLSELEIKLELAEFCHHKGIPIVISQFSNQGVDLKSIKVCDLLYTKNSKETQIIRKGLRCKKVEYGPKIAYCGGYKSGFQMEKQSKSKKSCSIFSKAICNFLVSQIQVEEIYSKQKQGISQAELEWFKKNLEIIQENIFHYSLKIDLDQVFEVIKKWQSKFWKTPELGKLHIVRFDFSKLPGEDNLILLSLSELYHHLRGSLD